MPSREEWKRVALAVPVVGPTVVRGARAARRYRLARSYYSRQLNQARRWSVARTEDSNFYYQLTRGNEMTLVATVAAVTGTELNMVRQFVEEVQSDRELHEHIGHLFRSDPMLFDARPALGRRLGWYAFVRVLKPKLVVETGVAHGVGSCVLASALLRNQAEGFPGRYLGTEIDPKAGQLLSGRYAEVGHIVYGDSLETLEDLDEPIDIFINDSDHSADYEASEYLAIRQLLSSDSVILGDNSHCTTALLDFAIREGRPYMFFKEEPANHWYPGAGIGISPSQIPLVGQRPAD